MAFFDNLAKRVSKGLDQATFEAEKLVRVNKLKTERTALRTELLQVKAVLADRVMALYGAGSLSLADLEEPIQAVGVLDERVARQEDELLTAQAETYQSREEVVMPVAPAAAPPKAVHKPAAPKVPKAAPSSPPEGIGEEKVEAPAGTAEASSRFCAECGAQLPEEAVFCANCGAEVLK